MDLTPEEKAVRKARRILAKAGGPPLTSTEPPRVFTSALEWAMYMINDPNAPDDMKSRLAIAAMPFQHPKLEAVGPGKKDQQDAAAKEAARGRFATPQPASSGEADPQRLLT